jgi:hypothetical protein
MDSLTGRRGRGIPRMEKSQMGDQSKNISLLIKRENLTKILNFSKGLNLIQIFIMIFY